MKVRKVRWCVGVLRIEKFVVGGGGVVACLIIVSLQVLSFELLTMNVEYLG